MKWKKIKGFENYEVSNEGQVRNKENGYILKLQIQRNGYLRVDLYLNGEQTHKLVHRLVAEAFIPNLGNKYQVNHINEDKTNNRVDNLEWCTAKENINYGARTKKAVESRKNNPEWRKSNNEHLQKLNQSKSKPIYALYLDDMDEYFPSAHAAARELGLSQGNISSVLKGRLKTTGGLRFEYAE